MYFDIVISNIVNLNKLFFFFFFLQGRLPAQAALIYTVHESLRRYCRRVWQLMASQLDLPYLTPLYVAACGRLQLGVAHGATSVSLLQVVDNLPHKQW